VSVCNTGLDKDAALVVSPKRAQAILDIGHTRLYQLIAGRELESYNEGRSRKITVRSLEAYIERQLGATEAV